MSHLEQEVQVGGAAEHLKQEPRQEGDHVILGGDHPVGLKLLHGPVVVAHKPHIFAYCQLQAAEAEVKGRSATGFTFIICMCLMDGTGQKSEHF